MATERLATLRQQPEGGTALSPVGLLKTLQRLRNEAAAEVERLISLMDAIDADPDFEPTGDEAEPQLGSVDGGTRRRSYDQTTWAAGLDAEPTLGSAENHPYPEPWEIYREGQRRTFDGSQLGWSTGNADDREFCADREEDDTHDGREPDVDDELSGDEEEPSLGSFDRLANQEHSYRQTSGGKDWIMFRGSDAELDR